MPVADPIRDIFERRFRGGERNIRLLAGQLGISRATAYLWRRKLVNNESLEPKYVSPKKIKFTTSVRRAMGQIIGQNPHKSALWLKNELRDRGIANVSVSGVQKVLRELGYRWCDNKRPNLTPANRRERLIFANEHIHTDWKRIWSYDESYFNLIVSSSRGWVKTSTLQRIAPRKNTTLQDSISLCIVVAVSYNYKSALCFLPKNWTPDQLINVLAHKLLPSIQWDPTLHGCRSFLLDNDGRHLNRRVKDFLHQNNLD